jgi:hypothetical protein
MSVALFVIKVHIFRIISLYHCLLIELQTSVKQDDTTRTRTPKPGYLNLSNVKSLVYVSGMRNNWLHAIKMFYTTM